ncbi:MAG TPA: hypothetical protein VK280_23130, partial [Streptosporangiaceae bacterium]|nr:hypothetical protein [Streptosporangiaceae bacterium]
LRPRLAHRNPRTIPHHPRRQAPRRRQPTRPVPAGVTLRPVLAAIMLRPVLAGIRGRLIRQLALTPG